MEDSEIFHDTYQDQFEMIAKEKLNDYPIKTIEFDNFNIKITQNEKEKPKIQKTFIKSKSEFECQENALNEFTKDLTKSENNLEDRKNDSEISSMIGLSLKEINNNKEIKEQSFKKKKSFIYITNPRDINIDNQIKVNINRKNTNDLKEIKNIQTFLQEKRSQEDCFNLKNTKINFENSTWIIKFSPDGNYLAVGGSDNVLRIYKSDIDPERLELIDVNCSIYKFHQSDIIDLSWHSSSKMILVASMDQKVSLWNIEKNDPVKIFHHPDIVSCVLYDLLDENQIFTGSFDKIIRIWDINSEKVFSYVHTPDLITCMAISPNGSMLVVGFLTGYVRIYKFVLKKIELFTEIQCKNKRNYLMRMKGKKLTHIQFIDNRYFLVTSNDSRIRLIDCTNWKQILKYKGYINKNYHIRSDYNFERDLILSASENGKLYIWNKESDYIPPINPKFTLQKLNRNSSYECFIPFEKSFPICAVFAPPQLYENLKNKLRSKNYDIFSDLIIVTVSKNSEFKIFVNLIRFNN